MIRILHIVGGMNRGGIETWLMHMLRNIDSKRFHMDFMVHTREQCAYDEEITSLGSRILPCMHPSSPWTYARNFRQVLHGFGPYHIVHSHVHHYSGYVLCVASRAGVPVRIAHSHNDTATIEAASGLLRSFYRSLMGWCIQRYGTIGLACSNKAATALFGPFDGQGWPWMTFPYAIDLTPFAVWTDPSGVRAELGIPDDALVLGHVGRFDHQKNHMFMVDIARELVKRTPNMVLLLVGDGPLRSVIEERVAEAGLTERVVMTGVRSDVPRLMSAMDVFVFPSLFEGLGLVLVEAQAAGLPCVVADVIPEEADVVEDLIIRRPLRQPASAWAEAILSATQVSQCISPRLALERVRASSFNVYYSARRVEEFYNAVYGQVCQSVSEQESDSAVRL